MLTIINQKELATIIQLSGQTIREFLSQANPDEFNEEAQLAIKSFQANPAAFSDDKLVQYGSVTVDAINYPVRIEVRGRTPEGAAQMVAKGIWGPERNEAVRSIHQRCKNLGIGIHLKLAGSSSFEFNVDGVDKAVPIRFIQVAFDSVLKEMNYQPGTHINSLISKTIVAADGDSTIYDGPKVGFLPSLADSPVKDVLCAYLKAGGVFMLVSGNDLNRSFKRIVDALPQDLYCRVLVAGNGGADLVYANAKGEAVPVSGYREQALDFIQSQHQDALDMVYIGDDGSMSGNDYPAFKAVGFNNSVLVASKFLDDYDPALRSSFVGELLQGTRKYLERFLLDRS